MKFLVIKYKVIIRCLFLGITNLFLVDSQCYAKTISDELYLKVELPVYKKVNFKDKKQGERDLTFSNQYAVGAGYVISPYLDAELMFDQSELHYEESSVNTSSNVNTYSNEINKPSSNKIDSKQLFGFAFPSTSTSAAHCAGTEAAFLTKEDICNTPTTTTNNTNNCTNVSGSSNSIKLNTLILSTKLKLFEQNELFIPYIFGGLGIVFGESKSTQFSKDISRWSFNKKKNNTNTWF